MGNFRHTETAEAATAGSYFTPRHAFRIVRGYVEGWNWAAVKDLPAHWEKALDEIAEAAAKQGVEPDESDSLPRFASAHLAARIRRDPAAAEAAGLALDPPKAKPRTTDGGTGAMPRPGQTLAEFLAERQAAMGTPEGQAALQRQAESEAAEARRAAEQRARWRGPVPRE